MAFKIVRFANLLLAALLAGNEFGTWAAVHPALEKLRTPERIRAEQQLTHRYAAMMPFWMLSVIASCLAVLASTRKTSSFLPTLLGTVCFVAMLLSTIFGNVPINNRIVELSPEEDSEEFVRLRKRWDTLHAFRVFMNVMGLGFLAAGALRERSSQ
jgi:hypothetical protein